jgi:uncharacterized protein YdeI (YjbR/CyaY-like superfamily)
VQAGVRPGTEGLDDTDVIACADATQWESWLIEHHERSSGVWLLIAKRGSEKVSVTIGDALDVALCFGWIDSQRRGLDADYYLQQYSPRRPKEPVVQAQRRPRRGPDRRRAHAGARPG